MSAGARGSRSCHRAVPVRAVHDLETQAGSLFVRHPRAFFRYPVRQTCRDAEGRASVEVTDVQSQPRLLETAAAILQGAVSNSTSAAYRSHRRRTAIRLAKVLCAARSRGTTLARLLVRITRFERGDDHDLDREYDSTSAWDRHVRILFKQARMYRLSPGVDPGNRSARDSGAFSQSLTGCVD